MTKNSDARKSNDNRTARLSGVRNQAYEETLDFIPTPPWATRAFLAVSQIRYEIEGAEVLECACGMGHISEVLKEAGAVVTSTDLVDRGYPDTVEGDFLKNDWPDGSFDWVITNPPYALSDDFVREMWRLARVGVVLHVRTGWLTGVKRHRDLLSVLPVSHVYMHAKNVPATQNKVIRRGSNNFNHSWVVWRKSRSHLLPTTLSFIPVDSQDKYERAEDYDQERM